MTNIEIGNRLKNLREISGLNQVQVAQYLNINIDEFKSIENGGKDFNLKILNKLCALYNCSQKYIILGGKEEHKPIKIKQKVNNEELKLIAKMNCVKKYLNILKEVNKKNTKSTIKLENLLNTNSNKLNNILMDNLTILWFPMPYEINGCCLKEENSFIIFINSNHKKEKQNFTINHMLYHLLIDKKSFYIYKKGKKNIKAEKFVEELLRQNNNLNIDIYNKKYYGLGEIVLENEKALKNHTISHGFYREVLGCINRLDKIYNTSKIS